MMFWTQAEAIALCREIEQICPRFGCHVALTGGCLYKDGPRKDADLLYNEMTGRPVFFCDSIGYGIPYATQYTNPDKLEDAANGATGIALATLPQADPNGLFSPASAEGTWILCKDPAGSDVKPVYIEPRVIVSPFRIEAGTRTAEKPETK